jgi:hypothetical protein
MENNFESRDKVEPDSISVILTGYKRDYFDEQINAILNQTIKPSKIYLWQNGNYVDLDKYREKYNINLIKSDENMKFHGRFAFGFLMRTEYVAIFDDDIVPGKKWLENCLRLSKAKNCIVGANGRVYYPNTKKWGGYDITVPDDFKMHFVGHCWFFKKEWLKYMWQLDPYTLDNAEDMQLCIGAKMFGNIDTYVAKQTTNDTMADTKKNKYATDQHASFKLIKNHHSIRNDIINYYISKGWDYKL